MEYISKDDAKLLIDVLNGQTYTLADAAKYIEIIRRLQSYAQSVDEQIAPEQPNP